MSWRLDELASAGHENRDPLHAERYDAKEDAGAAADVAALLARGLLPARTVVDIGAGTGQFALAVAPHAARVLAVDVSSVMLGRLQAKLRTGAAANVACVRAGFLEYEHAGPAADVVYSRLALHHLPDFWKAIALARMAAMLAPAGTLVLRDVVYGFEPATAGQHIECWIEAGAGEGDIAERWTRAELEEHVREEHSTFTWLLEPMLERAGFVIEEASYGEDAMTASYVCRRS